MRTRKRSTRRIVRRHVLEKAPISDLCDEYRMQPAQFYSWQKQLFEHAARAFEPGKGETRERELLRQVEELKATLRTKDEVIAEVTEAFVRAKKARGGA